MSATTPFLNLYKPGGGSTGTITPDEVVDVDRINQNSDLIDAFASTTDGRVDALETAKLAQDGRNQQFTGIAANKGLVTGMKLGDTYQESDAGKRLFVFTGVKWLPAPGSFIRLIASAQQSLGPGQQFTNWSAPGTASSKNQAGTELFTVTGGVITVVETGVYDVFLTQTLQSGSGTVVSSLRTGGVAGTVRSQNYVNLAAGYGTTAQHQLESIEITAGTTINIVDDIGGPLFWASGSDGNNYNSGLLSVTLKQILM